MNSVDIGRSVTGIPGIKTGQGGLHGGVGEEFRIKTLLINII
jgi:hypothetical protein